MSDEQQLFHVARADDWAAALETGEYRWSSRGLTLEDEGFIHASYAEQWEEVLAAHYADEKAPLVLLTVDPARVPADIRVEGGFPHVYGPLPVDAVVAVRPIER